MAEGILRERVAIVTGAGSPAGMGHAMALGLVRAGGYGGLGYYDRRAIAVLVLFAPVMALAMFAGDRWHAHLDQARFERIVALLLAGSGVALLLK